MKQTHLLWLSLASVLLVGAAVYGFWPRPPQWNEQETAAITALWIGNLPPLPPDPSNQYADDPRAAELGHKLFFDTRLSPSGEITCASCHLPELAFQDGRPLAQGVGITDRRTMTIVGMAYSPWLFWDGRKDSLWAQALGPLENPVEHGGDRTFYVHLLAQHYRADYEALFGPLPDISHLPPHAGPVPDPSTQQAWQALSAADQQLVNQIFANMGKAIAAYERQILPGASRFDAYAQALIEGDTAAQRTLLTAEEIAGLRLFIGKAECTNCHNGPLFTNNDFHNTGVPAVPGLPEDTGRALGAQQVLADEFNCLGPYSDAAPSDCLELRFLVAEGHELVRQYKPPTLRDVAGREPFMHAGQLATLAEVVAHYNTAPPAPAGHSELQPLNLSQEEMGQLIAFLHTLSAPFNSAPRWLQPPPALSAP